jgi:hypothetical protein
MAETKNVKCYALRFSLADVGGFILSYIDEANKVVHRKISNRGGIY